MANRKGRIRLTGLTPHAYGGVARLSLGTQPDGTKLILRELLPKYTWRWRMHLSFVRGTKIREKLTPHTNLVFSVERGYRGVCPYEVIEYVPGRNLREMIETQKDVVRAHAFDIMRQSAGALAYMHQNQILHLDVKPNNVIVNTTVDPIVVKLTDFDLSCSISNTRNEKRSGTLTYMAPEEMRSGVVGIQTDIFAFGVMCYYLVTGRMPFSAHSEKEMRRRQFGRNFQVESPRKINPDLMPKLDWIIMRCLEKDPEKRFPSMSFLCQEIASM